MSWFRRDEKRGCVVLTLHIQPGARETRVVGPHADALKIAVQAPPVEGRANAALSRFLGERFDVPLSQVVVKQGTSGRHKVVEIHRLDATPELLWSAA